MPQRRKFIKATALGGLSTIGLTNSVGAQNRTDDLGDEIREALFEDGTEAARDLFEDNSLEYDISTTSLGDKGEDEDDFSTNVTPDTAYSSDDTEVSCIVGGSNDDDHAWFTTYAELRGGKTTSDIMDHVDDIIMIGYDSDHWVMVEEPTYSTQYDYDFGTEEPLDASLYTGSFDGDGVAVRVETQRVTDPDNVQGVKLVDGEVILQSKFYNKSGLTNPVLSGYEHVGSFTDGGSILGIDIDLEVFGFELELGDGAEEIWNLADSGAP